VKSTHFNAARDAKKDLLRTTCFDGTVVAPRACASRIGVCRVRGTGDPRMLLVRGKGDKERMVPLSPRRAANRLVENPRRQTTLLKEGTPRSK
jgi:integrase/recombinase XerD